MRHDVGRGAGISGDEAAEILGVTRGHVYRLVLQGKLRMDHKHQRLGLDRDEVERRSLEHWRSGHPYWVTTREGAEILGVCPQRVRQLVARDFIPFVRRGQRYLFRRTQLEVVANARTARYLRQNPMNPSPRASPR